jgi:hydroxyacylglutathione hydrolase
MESSTYLLHDSANKENAMFTGDTVFLGDVGRPDLACSEDITSTDLAANLFDSVQKLKKYEDTIRIYPAHGSGSACGKSIGTGNFCTLGVQKTENYGFKFNSKE